MEKEYFKYGKKEIEYLKEKDKVLGENIDKIGFIKREIIKNPFEALISSIVSQQVSKKAAETVWFRFCNLIHEITPENIINIDDESIKKCGMSNRKVEYIKEIADAALSKRVDFNNLKLLTDEEIIKQLITIRGVGTWTAQMILIFSLNRLNVISYDDLGIRKGIINLYELEGISRKEFNEYKKKYSPYASVASLYLWELASK
ncbi:DNA-3-methyladenine glycosylase family protein [Tepidibacter hydrothermalis]|uniref:DNA-3-methyladenine glycosylase II n=1 Tax=Tepidibacter hydrothermalis TaxID=3036126 RepID=A0ABY8EGJ2_9FIRM|nr:DNA-3-methyladenine glycosylase [Tepidibacter hydrothermalis]WFD10975.1 DNA-3-methyladenine glycosylase [Tepidibacter hydrothermalis]